MIVFFIKGFGRDFREKDVVLETDASRISVHYVGRVARN